MGMDAERNQQPEPQTRRRVRRPGREWSLGLTLFIAGTIAAVLVIAADMSANGNALEKLREAGLQYLLTIVAAGGVTALLGAAAGDREQRIRDRQDLHQLQGSILDAFIRAKRARRLLRACAIAERDESRLVVAGKAYDDHLRELTDAQLALEAARLQLKDREYLIADQGLSALLKRMAEYLGDVVAEYERGFLAVEQSEPGTWHELPKLAEFTRHYERDAPFDTDFRKALGSARGVMSAALNDRV
jgi:hypothetical protein